MEHLPFTINGLSVYATFGQRFGAAIIDLLIVIPLVMGLQAFNTQTLGAELAIEILITLMSITYTVVLNYLYGGTLGKLAVGIRITHIDGSRIGLKTTLMRSLVDILLSVVTLWVFVVTLKGMDLTTYFAGNWVVQADLITANYPAWHKWTDGVIMAWYWSELLVMLTNDRRRALHDFIAGTVVIHKAHRKPQNTDQSMGSE